jgi:hypothetical protein
MVHPSTYVWEEIAFSKARFTLGVKANVQLKWSIPIWGKSWNQALRALH